MNARTTALLLAAIGWHPEAGAGVAPPAASDTRIRVAAVSFVPTKLAVKANADRLEALFREAAAGQARLAVAPEGALDGYVINQVLAEQMSVDQLRAAAL